MSNVWAALGIAPTSDLPSIRRAYAEKLRAIDQDKQPAAFMALRAAFTQALRLAGKTQSEPYLILAEVPKTPSPADPSQLREEARIQTLLQRFAAAEAAGATQPALEVFGQLQALGAGGGQAGLSALSVRMAVIAANDPATPTEDVDRLLEKLGLDAMALERNRNLPPIIELTKYCNQRLAAELWLRGLRVRADKKWWTKQTLRDRYANKVAAFMLGRRGQRGLISSLLIRELDKFDQHRRFAAASLDAARLDRARARIGRYRNSQRIIRWLLFGFFALAALLRAILESPPN